MARYLALVLLAACGSKGPDPMVDLAKRTVRKLATESYPKWATTNPNKACPAKIDELDGGAEPDPWGHPYKMFCGADLPPGVRTGFAILSFGPDGKKGTPDDIKSWER